MTMIRYKIFIKVFLDFNIISALMGLVFSYFIDHTYQEDFIHLGLMVIILLLNEKMLRYQSKIGIIRPGNFRSGMYSLLQALFIHLIFISMILAWIDMITKYFNLK